MSTFIVNNLRKRRSDDESSDSDEEIINPLKKRRFGQPNMQERCTLLWKWFHPLPEHIKKQRVIHLSTENEPGDMRILDDDDVEHKDSIQDNVNEKAAALKKEVCNNTRGSGLPTVFTKPIYYRDGTQVGYRHLSPATNGYHSKNPKTKDSLQKSQQQPRSKSYASPLKDVQLLEELPGAADSAALEIVADISHNRRSSKPSEPVMSPITGFDGASFAGPSYTSRKGDPNGTDLKIYRMPADTVNELNRLDEKAQYEKMLEKIYASPPYYPKMKPTNPIFIDLTEKDEDSLCVLPFNREKKPVGDFFEKYRKAAQLVPLTSISNDRAKKLFGPNADKIETKPVAFPEYKPIKLTNTDFSNPNWLKDLQALIKEETENRMRIVRQQEDKVKRYQDRRDAKIAKEKELLEKYRVPGDVFPEEVNIVEEFPALTPEMEARIRGASQDVAGRSLEEMSSKFNFTVLRKHMVTLHGKNWLVDEIINFYLNMIMERSKAVDNLPTVYVYNTYFYTAIKRTGAQGVMRWTRKVDIFSYDLLLIPLHLDVHWTLCVVDHRSKTIRYYDSMGSGHSPDIIKPIRDYLILDKKSKKNIVMDPSEYQLEVVKDLPKQQNGSDCGVFALKYAEYISRDAEITFEQEHMAYFRRRMVYEILTQQLM